MRSTRFGIFRKLTAAALACSAGAASAAGPVYLHQGSSWTPAARADFYTRDQGSRLIPFAWAKALKAPDGAPFLADGLARYGYLPNPANANRLPVGFMTGVKPEAPVSGDELLRLPHPADRRRHHRIPGRRRAPLSSISRPCWRTSTPRSARCWPATRPSRPSRRRCSGRARPRPRSPSSSRKSPPGICASTRSWPGRCRRRAGASAASTPSRMIFNRLVGMDIGPPPSFLIPENIALADAPVRYPFLWNAPKQDRTQWPGFSKNGDDLFALTRNLGQVYGVFGIFRPTRQDGHVDFLAGNSTQWKGLEHIENLVRKIGPPRWPWALDAALVAQGKRIYDRPTGDGGCAECHGKRPGAFRFIPPRSTWATPLCDVGTDTRECGHPQEDGEERRVRRGEGAGGTADRGHLRHVRPAGRFGDRSDLPADVRSFALQIRLRRGGGRDPEEAQAGGGRIAGHLQAGGARPVRRQRPASSNTNPA